MPGDRDDSVIEEAARIAASGFHRIIIKEDNDLRGRKKGEAAQLMCRTVNRVSPGRRCDIVLDEVEAFSNAVGEIKEDEVIVVFYDKLEPVMKILERRGAVPVAAFDESADRDVLPVQI